MILLNSYTDGRPLTTHMIILFLLNYISEGPDDTSHSVVNHWQTQQSDHTIHEHNAQQERGNGAEVPSSKQQLSGSSHGFRFLVVSLSLFLFFFLSVFLFLSWTSVISFFNLSFSLAEVYSLGCLRKGFLCSFFSLDPQIPSW